jgi:hypothetical protein
MHVHAYREDEKFNLTGLEYAILHECATAFGYTYKHEEWPPDIKDSYRNVSALWVSGNQSGAIASALEQALDSIPKDDRTQQAYDDAILSIGQHALDLRAQPMRLTLDFDQMPLLLRTALCFSRAFFSGLLSGPNRKVVEDYIAFLKGGEHSMCFSEGESYHL